jgi:predicted DNA-binding ribbon-helix-helix protein
MPDVRGAFPNIDRRTMTAGRYEGATAEKAVPFPNVVRWSCFFASVYDWYKNRNSKTKPEMKSLIVKRSVVLGGHKTSVSLEDAFWKSLKQIAASGKMTVSELLTAIDSGRHHGNLSSAIRLFVLNYYREQLLDRLHMGDKREEIQRLISASARTPL